MKSARLAPVLIIATVLLFAAACSTVSRELGNVEPINLKRGVIAGSVTDSASNQPIIGARITLLTAAGDSVRGQQAGTFSFAPGGAYRMDDVVPGSYLLRATAAGYVPATSSVNGLSAGERHSVAFRLRRIE